jgi:hypothetical protein
MRNDRGVLAVRIKPLLQAKLNLRLEACCQGVPRIPRSASTLTAGLDVMTGPCIECRGLYDRSAVPIEPHRA